MHLILGLPAGWVATGILVLTYVALMIDRLNRAVVVGIGACAMIIIGVLDQQAAIAGIDFNTIMLLAGMMIIVGIMRRTGVFEYVAIWSVKLARARPAGILLGLGLTTAIVSALLDNVTTVLLVVPVTIGIAGQLEVPAYPFLVAEILASNIGGTATLIGDPPNVMIGSAANLSFNAFLVNLAPVIVVILAANALVLHLKWGRKLRGDVAARERVLALNPREFITDSYLLKRCLAVLGGVMAAFVLSRELHLEPGTIAMSGAFLLVLLETHPHPREHQTTKVRETLSDIEWITLFFFMGLFVVVAGVEHAGVIDQVARWVLEATGGKLVVAASVILWSSALLSAVVDNIPFVAAMIPLIKETGPQLTGGRHDTVVVLWWALALGACLGGNGTLIGASANVTAAGLAERQGIPFHFLKFTKVALPIMLMSIAIAQVYLYLRFF